MKFKAPASSGTFFACLLHQPIDYNVIRGGTGGITMIRPIFFAALTLALLVPIMNADAQQPLRKNETYCLQSSGGADGGGGMPLLCRFETLAQCNASKTANSDYCLLDPVIAFSRRGY